MESNNFENIGSNIANSESKTIDKNKLLCAFLSFNLKSNLDQTPFTKMITDEMNNIEVIEDNVEVDDKLIILKIDQTNNDKGKISMEANMKPDTMEYAEKAINVEEIIIDENKSVDIHKHNNNFGCYDIVFTFDCDLCMDNTDENPKHVDIIHYFNDSQLSYILHKDELIPKIAIHLYLRLLIHSLHNNKENTIIFSIINSDSWQFELNEGIKRRVITTPLTIYAVVYERFEKLNEGHFYAIKLTIKNITYNQSKRIVCSAVMYNGVITEDDDMFGYQAPIERVINILNYYNIEVHDGNLSKNINTINTNDVRKKPRSTLAYVLDIERLSQSSEGIDRNACGGLSCLEITIEIMTAKRAIILKLDPENNRKHFCYELKLFLSSYRDYLSKCFKHNENGINKRNCYIAFFKYLRIIQYTCTTEEIPKYLNCKVVLNKFTFENNLLLKNGSNCSCQTILPSCHKFVLAKIKK